MRRNSLSLRRKTKLCLKLPAEYEKKSDFQKEVICPRKEKDYMLSVIGSTNQTPVWFYMPNTRMIDIKGSKSVISKTASYEKLRVMVMLTCMSDGTKLKPLLVFNRKTVLKNFNFPPVCVVTSSNKGWVTAKIMKELWIKNLEC